MTKTIKILPADITTSDLMKVDLGYNFTEEELHKDWERLQEVEEFKTGSQWKPGLKICQQFCDNFFDIKSREKCFNDVFADPVLMDKILVWGKTKMSALYITWIRKAIYMASGMRNPSYYRPHLAKQIIRSTGKSEGILFDPCSGWGGRMLGTVAAGWHYVGCEPNKETYTNLIRIVDFLNLGGKVELHNCPFEDFDLESLGKVDIVLTSPPYFNVEVYSNDITQSYNKYPDFSQWMDEWLLVMIRKCHGILKPGGLSCYNAMDWNKKYKFVDGIMDAHLSNGWKLTNQYGIDSPFINYKGKLNKKDLTYVFEK
jgi:hypothetical protein